MTASARFPDWADLTAGARDKLCAGAAAHARRLEPRLNAFIAIADAGPAPADGPLRGMPYAVKDIFRIAGREPSGGLGAITDLGIAGESDMLRRLDAAGGQRGGFTALAALAYARSGHNPPAQPSRHPRRR